MLTSVESAAATLRAPTGQPRILMCPPDYYGIEYEINAWMSRERQSDHAIAIEAGS